MPKVQAGPVTTGQMIGQGQGLGKVAHGGRLAAAGDGRKFSVETPLDDDILSADSVPREFLRSMINITLDLQNGLPVEEKCLENIARKICHGCSGGGPTVDVKEAIYHFVIAVLTSIQVDLSNSPNSEAWSQLAKFADDFAKDAQLSLHATQHIRPDRLTSLKKVLGIEDDGMY